MNSPRCCLAVKMAVALALTTHARAGWPMDTVPAQGGTIRITPVFHASLEIELAGKVIAVDPISAGMYPRQADLVLITHAHPDHFDRACIQKIAASSDELRRSKLRCINKDLVAA